MNQRIKGIVHHGENAFCEDDYREEKQFTLDFGEVG